MATTQSPIGASVPRPAENGLGRLAAAAGHDRTPVHLRVSQINGCVVCLETHARP
ncbi:MAG: hypothetical protein ACM3ML_22560 [Micromonosporaceae bacterium]